MKMNSQDTFVKLENRPIKCEYGSDDNFESPQQTYPMVSSIPKEILSSNDVQNQVKPEKEIKTLPQEGVDAISDSSIYPAELVKKEKTEYDGTVIEYVGNAVNSGQEQFEIVTQFDDEKVSQYTVVLSSEYPKQDQDETILPSVSVASAFNVENPIIQSIKKEPELDISMEEKYDIYMEENEFDDFDEFDYDDDKSQIQTSATSLKCPGCPFESLVREVLAKHLVDEHIDGKMCKLCNLEFEDSVAQHCSKHLPEAQTSKRGAAGNSEILECTICSIMFPFRSEYIRHIKTTHSYESWDKNELQCEVCLESFETKYQLARHYRTHPDLKPFNCNMCSKIFRFRFSLNKHIELRHTGDRPRPFECKICSKKFTTKFSLMDHVRRHTGEVPFKCEICSKAFLHNNELKTHMVLMHDINDKKYFKCEICSKIFWRKNPYMEHMRSHSGAEPFKCELCSKIFELSRNLEKHVKICQRTYSCDMCSKKLTTKFGLDAHMRLHTGERPFKCEFCGKTFRYKNNLKIHMAQNHDITDKCCLTCTRCQKVFRNKAYYERHMRVHTGERPYRCEICKMTFGCRSTMKRHTMNIHTDPDQQVREKPTTATTTGNMKRIKDIGADEDSVEEKVTKKRGN